MFGLGAGADGGELTMDWVDEKRPNSCNWSKVGCWWMDRDASGLVERQFEMKLTCWTELCPTQTLLQLAASQSLFTFTA